MGWREQIPVGAVLEQPMFGAASTAALNSQLPSEQPSNFRNCPSGILPLLTSHPWIPTTPEPSERSSSHISLGSSLVLPRRAAAP